MREIKFRCWDKKHKEMFYSNHERRLATFFDMFTGECCTEVIMQYTSLKDKNGKEIYEGDIVRYSYFTPYGELNEFVSEVKFDIDKIIITKKTANTWYFLSSMSKHCEVIGNIYENPSLLEGLTNV